MQEHGVRTYVLRKRRKHVVLGYDSYAKIKEAYRYPEILKCVIVNTYNNAIMAKEAFDNISYFKRSRKGLLPIKETGL